MDLPFVEKMEIKFLSKTSKPGQNKRAGWNKQEPRQASLLRVLIQYYRAFLLKLKFSDEIK